ncbi:hypothetical protein IQ268_10740 [Oculatella sp. LEGE 06141]|uniref:hypothetical protein n=1 Tax=Oculatella sp. LEGE 06141 TaxID=1828648 RepID=UPI00187EECD1|nr:hypothetical protein [Oculatella sp. LEGE 06141]MBE9179037.1 hypothetical protein [Oculatella sp. LEGE 06141]
MGAYPAKQRISVEIDAAVVHQLDQLTDDRTQAIEAAIRLWCQQQATQNLKQAAALRHQLHDNDETGWLV